jgi:rare lipoprotein A
VNDRGPFVAARIIDLSRAAAEVLDMLSTGTAPVIVEAVMETAQARTPLQAGVPVVQEQAPVSYPAAEGAGSTGIYFIGPMPPVESVGSYRLQIGAYKIPRNAVAALERLKTAGLNPAYEKSDDLYRVVLPGLTAKDIPPVSEKLKTAGFTQAIIRKE